MKEHPHFQWIRPAQQVRSRQTHERLLDSAEALIADKGFDDITVVEIAARAGFAPHDEHRLRSRSLARRGHRRNRRRVRRLPGGDPSRAPRRTARAARPHEARATDRAAQGRPRGAHR
ncbi:MAG: TetR family transcriptional regulator [Deltaproteobacteria bacterium]|nr:TetR family transcriptional regulator [Deltaproteobacteria bacterium]